ncbi:MAG: fumarylacetoacetate hydrolase family protein [Proteobacteria bacterium]|nr:fumarylacetoacetate hydrolase family protein [Pseudomonadota bacterium]
MKLVRFGPAGREKPGLVDRDGNLRDLSGVIADVTPDSLAPRALARLARIKPARLPLVGGRRRLGPPLAGIGKLVCVGLNYADHAKESGMPIPEEPVLFMKSTTAISGPYDPVVIPKGSKKTDWEVELGVVIGRTARYVPKRTALDHVAGYCIVNDVSERELQLEGSGQWVKGKSADSFAPIGPWLVSRDEIGNPQALDLWLDVNGARMQSGNTRTMIFGVATLVSYISKCMTLLPGDVISTGTPPGVGLGRTPPRYLKPGDVMRLGIDGLGEQRLKVVRYRPK